ncbi:hypothetical protein [Halodesulfovibrio sp.]|uniref:InlB B-repeat-containing protein n=1 Tax=Halodesulfovibrio sp. TaxID=1912772 RepID=UPI0025E921F3|nr:hypothetical protein [Halodesulfovibrio sp.]MCT4535239.1 hypothetical protein [Halodesulfovibrio sp.]
MKRLLPIAVLLLFFCSTFLMPAVASAGSIEWKGQTWSSSDSIISFEKTADGTLKIKNSSSWSSGTVKVSTKGKSGVNLTFKNNVKAQGRVELKYKDKNDNNYINISQVSDYSGNQWTRTLSGRKGWSYAFSSKSEKVSLNKSNPGVISFSRSGSSDNLQCSFGGLSVDNVNFGSGVDFTELRISINGYAKELELTDFSFPDAGGGSDVKHTVSVTAEANGSASASGDVEVAEGNDYAITFTPDAGYVVDKVFVDTVDKTSTLTAGDGFKKILTISKIAKSHSVRATFKQHPPLDVTVTVKGNGTVTSGDVTLNNANTSHVFSVSYDGSVSLAYTAADGYQLKEIREDGSKISSPSNPHVVDNVTRSIPVSVEFEKEKFDIAITKSGYSGTVSPSSPKVARGEDQRITFTSAYNTAVGAVIIDEGTDDEKTYYGIPSYTFKNVTKAHTVKVDFVAAKYTVTPTSPTNGTIFPSSAVKVAQNGKATFFFTPASGYTVKQVMVGGNKVADSVSEYTVENIGENKTIAVEFKSSSSSSSDYTITPQTTAGGSISPSSPVDVASGGTQKFTFTPDSGYVVKEVQVDGSKVAGNVSSFDVTNVQKNATIKVVYEKVAVTRTITVSSNAGGSVSEEGTVTVADGSSKIFTFTPDVGYEIKKVMVDNSPVTVASSYQFTSISQNHTLAVEFAKKQYTVNITSPSHGTVTASANSVEHGGSVTFTVTPAAGYTLSSFKVNNKAVAVTSNKATVSPVTGNVTAVAAFVQASNDSDNDGIEDSWEQTHFGSLSKDGTGDTDNDGLSDIEEYRQGADPNDNDSDDDGMTDGWEVEHGLSVNVNDANGDKDGDGASNLQEFQKNTDPDDAHSVPSASKGKIPVPVMSLLMS